MTNDKSSALNCLNWQLFMHEAWHLSRISHIVRSNAPKNLCLPQECTVEKNLKKTHWKKLLWNTSLSLFSVTWGIRVNLNILTRDNTSQKTEKVCVTGSLAKLKSNFHEFAWNSGLYMKSHEDFMQWICLIFFISRQDSSWKPSENDSKDKTKHIWDFL